MDDQQAKEEKIKQQEATIEQLERKLRSKNWALGIFFILSVITGVGFGLLADKLSSNTQIGINNAWLFLKLSG